MTGTVANKMYYMLLPATPTISGFTAREMPQVVVKQHVGVKPHHTTISDACMDDNIQISQTMYVTNFLMCGCLSY